MLNGLYVVQKGQAYHIFTPQGEKIGLVFMGYDGQYAKDVIALQAITKALGQRWRIKQDNN